MEKKSVLTTLGFVFFTIASLLLIFCAVVITVLNTYRPAVKTYLNGKFIGYFSTEQQFDNVYNELVAEKQIIDQNVKVFLDSEPNFQSCYIKENLIAEQNVYTNLRAEINTEYTVYNVAVNDENKMTFNTQDEANKYAESLKKEVSKLKTEVKIEKVAQLGEMTSLDRAETIMKDIVSRNKPVEIPKKAPTYKAPVTKYTGGASDVITVNANSQNGIWPTSCRNISSTFGYRGDYHTGIDLSGPPGSPIYAYKDGVVTFAGWNTSGYGNLVKVDHGNGFSTWYAHCSAILVSAGQTVTQGQTIAQVGRTGWATGNHLHFEVRINGTAINPYSYIAGK